MNNSSDLNLGEVDLNDTGTKLIKKLIWLFFWLLIFEGALRKWVLPSLATPLLIIRDPLAIYILFIARKRGLLPITNDLVGMILIGVLGMFTSMVSGHRNIFVAIYGVRPFILYFPLIYIIGNVFEREDVIKMGKILCFLAIPMTVLIAAQFYSPQSAYVNRGIGGDTSGGGFSGALGYYRPPGTFSFITGTVQFYALTCAFICFQWLDKSSKNILILICSTVALLLAIPFSISRSLTFHVVITVLFAIVGGFRKPKQFLRLTIASLGILVVYLFINNTNYYNTGIDVLGARFENANASEGGVEGTLINRFIGGLLNSFVWAFENPIFGYGLGIGTNVASMLMRGYVDFTVGEDEWSRNIGELGLVLGFFVIFIRVRITFKLFKDSFHRLGNGDFLPWLLVSVSSLFSMQGNWAQPTSLGFSILMIGLTYAALKPSK